MGLIASVKARTHYTPVEVKGGIQELIRAYQRSVFFGILAIALVCIVLNDIEKLPQAVGTVVLVTAGFVAFILAAMGTMYAGLYLVSLLFFRPLFTIRENRLHHLRFGTKTTMKGETNAQAE